MLSSLIYQIFIYTDVGRKWHRCVSEGSVDPIWSSIPSEDTHIKCCPRVPGSPIVPSAPDGRRIKVEPTFHKEESGIELMVIFAKTFK